MFLVLDFQCNDCGAIAEHLVKQGDAIPECPKCGSSSTTRLIGAPKLGYTAMATSGKPSSDAMTSSIDRWAKARAQKQRTQERNLARHGTED